MRGDHYCTDLQDVTPPAVYQSLATSIRTMVKALPRAFAMPLCRPEVAGGLGRAQSYRVAMRDDLKAGRTNVGRYEDRVCAFLDRANGTASLIWAKDYSRRQTAHANPSPASEKRCGPAVKI
jgi:hypothetical protein